jgi:hypothetical protein
MLLTHKPRELLDYGLERGQLLRILGFFFFIAPNSEISHLWLFYPLSLLNYNLIMTKDHQCINDLFWNISLVFPVKDQVYQGLLGTLPLSQEDRRDFVTQPLILIWLLQNELACCDLTHMETNLSPDSGCSPRVKMWFMSCTKDAVHDLYRPPRLLQRPEEYVLLTSFLARDTDFPHPRTKHLFISCPSGALQHLLPVPSSCSLPSTFQRHLFPGLLSLPKENWLCLKAVIKNICLWSLLQFFFFL